MDFPNAFVGKTAPPNNKEIKAALGPATAAWNELVAWLIGQGLQCGQWQSISPRYRWALRPKFKARTILHLSPCESCFRASFALSDKAVAAARASELPKSLISEIAGSRRYAEGTAVRLVVKGPKDLGAVRKLVAIKLAN